MCSMCLCVSKKILNDVKKTVYTEGYVFSKIFRILHRFFNKTTKFNQKTTLLE